MPTPETTLDQIKNVDPREGLRLGQDLLELLQRHSAGTQVMAVTLMSRILADQCGVCPLETFRAAGNLLAEVESRPNMPAAHEFRTLKSYIDGEMR